MESLTRSATEWRNEPTPEPPGQVERPERHPRLRPVGVLGIGSYVPERILTNADLERIVDTSDDWIFSRTGIKERRVAAVGETTADMAVHAGAKALEDAGLTGSDVDLVLVCTVTGDQPFPATASLVQHRLGASCAGAFDLGAGCSGFIYGLAVGAQFIRTGMYRHVLVVGAETLSRITNWRDRTTCVLFGDGAGAAVLGLVPDGSGFLAFDLGSDGAGADMLAVEPGGWGHPVSTGSEAPVAQSIRMAGGEVFKFAVRVLEDSTRRVLGRAGLSVEDVDCLIPHQANIRIIDAAEKRLRIHEDRIFNNVDRYGNTSAASIPIALDEARRAGRFHPGDTVALVGFGAGLAWGSCVLNWTGPATPEANLNGTAFFDAEEHRGTQQGNKAREHRARR